MVVDDLLMPLEGGLIPELSTRVTSHQEKYCNSMFWNVAYEKLLYHTSGFLAVAINQDDVTCAHSA